MSKPTESSVSTIASLAVMYHVEQYQNVDKDTEVKYPASSFSNFKSYVDNKGDVSKENGVSKSKVFTLEPAAIEFLNKFFKDKFIDAIGAYWKDSESSFESFKTLSKDVTGLLKTIFDISEASPSTQEFNETISETTGRLLGDLNAGLKSGMSVGRKQKEKVKAKDEREMSADMKENIVNSVVSTLYNVAEVLASNLMFNSTTTTSKITVKEVSSALMYVAYKYTDISEFYEALGYAGMRIETKVTKAKAASTTTKKKTTAVGKTKASKKANISDDEEEDDEPRKTTNKRVAKKTTKEEENSDSDEINSDNE